MLRAGDAAPDFLLKDGDGRDVRLSTLGGPIVLYFYPRDSSLGCTLQARSFRDEYEEIARRGAQVVGVSLDKPESHRRFCARNNIPYPLLSDPEGRVHDLYEAWRTSLLGRSPIAVRRCTFLIDEDGIIRKVHRNVNPLRHAKQVVKDLDRMAAQKSWGQEGQGGQRGPAETKERPRRRERPPVQ
jgi:thioredoxin-dependent peroxiredoxin